MAGESLNKLGNGCMGCGCFLLFAVLLLGGFAMLAVLAAGAATGLNQP